MGEKKEKNKIDTENLKNETVEAAKKVKETIKGTSIKEDTKNTKNFILEMIKNPLEKLKEVATDNSNKFFKTAIMLIIVWTLLIFIGSTYSTIYYWGFTRVFRNILIGLKNILSPTIGILVYSIIVLMLNKKNKKSLTTIISTITITQIPLILSTLASLLTIISTNMSLLTKPFASLCLTIATILGYFGFKNLFGEEGSKTFIKKYVLIQSIYYIAYILIGLLGIYI